MAVSKELWERPFTMKRYLHPPVAEEMVTMWSQFMFLIGDIYKGGMPHQTPAGGLCFLHGEDDEEFDLTTVHFETRDDGFPIHAFSFDMGDWSVRAEAFCDSALSPTAFIKVSLTNPTLWPVSGTLGMITRTAVENTLHAMGDPDGYRSYHSNVRFWGNAPRTWKFAGDTLSDGTFSIRFGECPFDLRWQGEVRGLPWYRRGILKVGFTLEPGETRSMTLAFRKGEPCEFDYDREKANCEQFWEGELARIRVYPNGDNPKYRTLIRSLTAQCLQMFCRYIGEPKSFIPRQGGTQRRVWVCEAFEFLKALDRIGDYFHYTQAAYDFFFDSLQIRDGDDAGQIGTEAGSIPWAGATGSALSGLSYHLKMRGDKALFLHYRDRMFAAFEWVERKRAESVPGKYPGAGVLPPLRACDWEIQTQNWTKSDLRSLEGYLDFADCLKFFADPELPRVDAAIADYRRVLKEIVDNVQSEVDDDELMLCGAIGEVLTDPTVTTANIGDDVFLSCLGVIAHDGEEMRKVERYYENRGMYKNGLHNLMHATAGGPTEMGYTWYVNYGDKYWFDHYMALGDRENAWAVLQGQLKYGMSQEYYMLERYSSSDRYFVPWMPNASANGRTIRMLCDYFGV